MGSRSFKVAAMLMKRYGIVVEPESLSDAALDRLESRVKFPRIGGSCTIREWADTVLGSDEQVRFYLPQSPRRNTHLNTLKFLSFDGIDLYKHMLKEARVNSPALTGLTPEEDSLVEDDDPVNPDQVKDESLLITASANSGLNMLYALVEEEERWEPVIYDQIKKLLVVHKNEQEMDTLDAFASLLDTLNETIKAARGVLNLS